MFIPITGPLGSWTLDLMFYDQYATTNKNYGCFLVGIEMNTRFIYVVPMKKKDQYNSALAFGKLYTNVDDNITPINILSDNGTEFKNKVWSDICNTLGFNHSFAEKDDHHKLGLVDRVIYTLRLLIEKYMVIYKTKSFINVLDDLVYNYNNTTHTALNNMTPQQAIHNLHETMKIQLEKKSKGEYGKEKVHEFKTGDTVRTKKVKTKMDKGSLANYNEDVETVDKVVGNRIQLNDGSLLPINRLQKIKKTESLPIKKTNEEDPLKTYKHALKLNRQKIFNNFTEVKDHVNNLTNEVPEEIPTLRRSGRTTKPIERLKY